LSEGEKIDFAQILDPEKWNDERDLVLYPCAGSFCGFLAKELGREKFLKLYGSLDRDKPVEQNLKLVEFITNKSIGEWQKLWEQDILSD
jgi:hypothetical protein